MADLLAPKDATTATAEANAAVARALPLDDPTDWARATKGLLAGPGSPQIRAAGGWPVWDHGSWSFLDGEAPPTVNPSLWRQAKLNRVAGLFEVVDGVYQVRGFDLSNITFIAGDSGWIVVDPLTSAETAAAALALATEHLGDRPVRAVVYTHSHVDHFAGVRGVVDVDAVGRGEVEIVAPAGFLEAAITENVLAGTAMTRRATYMYGALLPRHDRGHVDAGLGKGVPLLGSSGLVAPTIEVESTGTTLVLDGVTLEFHLTPGTEAPAEMNFYLPHRRALCMAENCSANQHNLYTPRGAQVRDALRWSKELQVAIDRYADRSDVLFTSHHWPRWGADDIVEHLSVQRDLYRFLHDETLRLANRGLTMVEIAEELELPEALRLDFSARDYYGTVNHNAKAVYQRYLGWFDGNPAHLHPHPPVEAARRYVEFMGGADTVLARARDSFEAGDYRWVAEVVNHVVFADPANTEARALQADALEQLGYQAESGPWRDFYLTGAQELRSGSPRGGGGGIGGSADVVAAMTVEMLIDEIGVRLDGPRAAASPLTFALEVTDRDETWTVAVERGAVHATTSARARGAHPTVRCTHAALANLVLGLGDTAQDQASGDLVADDADLLGTLAGLLDRFELFFPIIEP